MINDKTLQLFLIAQASKYFLPSRFDLPYKLSFSSCNEEDSCQGAQLSGVDLINSCNKEKSCKDTNVKGAFTELIDCCNDEAGQCRGEYGNDIVADGCVSHRISYEYCD